MSSHGNCDIEDDSRHASVAPRDATGTAADSPRNISPCHAEDFSYPPGLPVPLEYDARTRICDTTLDFTVNALSTHSLQSQFATTGTPPFHSPILAAGSIPQHAASSNAAARTLVSEKTDEQPVPSWVQHVSRPSLSLVTGVQHAELATINSG